MVYVLGCAANPHTLQRVKALIVPDKFKGTLSAQQVADAVAAGWKAARPSDTVESLPMTDGGDGLAAGNLSANPPEGLSG